MYTHSNPETRQTQAVDVLEITPLPEAVAEIVDGGDGGRLVRELDLVELQRRAGGLARELGQQYGFSGPEWRTHWSDMTQTALLAFLENSDQPLSYAYACARTALKNYGWVHVRGLNGGWKSLAARDYTLVDTVGSIGRRRRKRRRQPGLAAARNAAVGPTPARWNGRCSAGKLGRRRKWPTCSGMCWSSWWG
ncbi:MAG: hypothetical protein IPK53_10215 [bacterium]|nr:hypothetical protein [bacterium]